MKYKKGDNVIITTNIPALRHIGLQPKHAGITVIITHTSNEEGDRIHYHFKDPKTGDEWWADEKCISKKILIPINNWEDRLK